MKKALKLYCDFKDKYLDSLLNSSLLQDSKTTQIHELNLHANLFKMYVLFQKQFLKFDTEIVLFREYLDLGSS
jgi:hypothetical protein